MIIIVTFGVELSVFLCKASNIMGVYNIAYLTTVLCISTQIPCLRLRISDTLGTLPLMPGLNFM